MSLKTVTFFVAPVGTATGTVLGPDAVYQHARNSLVLLDQIVFPNRQPSFAWRRPEPEAAVLWFYLNRGEPRGELSVAYDGAIVSTREATPLESASQVLLAGALLVEAAAFLRFISMFLPCIERAGNYEFGMNLSGWNGAWVDFGSLITATPPQGHPLVLVPPGYVWQYSGTAANYFGRHITVPGEPDANLESVGDIAQQLFNDVVGYAAERAGLNRWAPTQAHRPTVFPGPLIQYLLEAWDAMQQPPT